MLATLSRWVIVAELLWSVGGYLILALVAAQSPHGMIVPFVIWAAVLVVLLPPFVLGVCVIIVDWLFTPAAER